jgi:hypothetical protein
MASSVQTVEKTKTDLTPEALERAEAHPLAVPFLFLGRKSVQDKFIYVALCGLIITVILGFIYPLHYPTPYDVVPASWAWIGFLSYSFLVLCAKPLFKALARPESYYGEDPDMNLDHIEEEAHHD